MQASNQLYWFGFFIDIEDGSSVFLHHTMWRNISYDSTLPTYIGIILERGAA
jgi:hypothetical protein